MFAAECRPAQAGRQHGAVPAPALLHAGLRSADVARQPAVPRPVGARVDAADVRRQEHDGGVRPASRALPDRGGHLPRTDVDARGRRSDVERAKQEQQLLRRVDPEQRQDGGL